MFCELLTELKSTYGNTVYSNSLEESQANFDIHQDLNAQIQLLLSNHTVLTLVRV